MIRPPLPSPLLLALRRAARTCSAVLVAGTLLLGLSGPAAAGDEGLQLDPLVERVQQVYRETRDLTASFEQSYHFKVTGRSKKSSGRVYLKLPGKMRWDYLAPEPKHFIADGRTLWVIAPQDRQVMRQPLVQSEISSVLGFLMGSGELRTQFELQLLGRDASLRYRLKLVPRGGETLYRHVVLVIEPLTFRTVETEVTDAAGNLNHLVFREIKVNQGLPDSGFSFVIPDGYRIIEAASPTVPGPDSSPGGAPDAPDAPAQKKIPEKQPTPDVSPGGSQAPR